MMSNIEATARKLEAKSSLYESEVFLPEFSRHGGAGFWPGANSISEVRRNAEDWQKGLELLLIHYAFTRNINPARYKEIAVKALRAVASDAGGFPALAARVEPGGSVLDEFNRRCAEGKVGRNERLNRVLAGLTNFAAKKAEMSPVLYVRDKIAASGRVEPLFIELLSVIGVGQKIASIMLRDIVWLYDLESRILREDLLYFQPIDIWLRRVADWFWPGLGFAKQAVQEEKHNREVPPFVVAKRLAKLCYSTGISGPQFNQGAWYFCAREVKEEGLLGQRLGALARDL